MFIIKSYSMIRLRPIAFLPAGRQARWASSDSSAGVKHEKNLMGADEYCYKII